MIFHQIHKRVWPSSQRDTVFASHIRKLGLKEEGERIEKEIENAWIVTNWATEHDDAPVSNCHVSGVYVCISSYVDWNFLDRLPPRYWFDIPANMKHENYSQDCQNNVDQLVISYLLETSVKRHFWRGTALSLGIGRKGWQLPTSSPPPSVTACTDKLLGGRVEGGEKLEKCLECWTFCD